jgi:NAD+ diphosphatase
VIDRPSPLADLALSQPGIDRSVHRRGDEAWLSQRWADPKSRVLLVADGQLATASDADPPGIQLRWQSPDSIEGAERYLLGVDGDDRALFAARVAELPTELQPKDIRELATRLDPKQAALMVHAVALANWHASHPFCPRCGGPTEVALAGAERRCTVDGTSHFPRTDPAIIVLVTDPSERALLGRQRAWPAGRFSTLAGFVEPGEAAEQAVVREVNEESGLKVIDVRYLGSQPWPFPASLMLGFAASSSGEDPVADGEELEEVRWFSRGELASAIEAGEVVAPGGISISRRLIERWYGGALPSGPPGLGWR